MNRKQILGDASGSRSSTSVPDRKKPLFPENYMSLLFPEDPIFLFSTQQNKSRDLEFSVSMWQHVMYSSHKNKWNAMYFVNLNLICVYVVLVFLVVFDQNGMFLIKFGF